MGRKGLFFFIVLALEACGFADAGGNALDKPDRFGDDAGDDELVQLPPSKRSSTDDAGAPVDSGRAPTSDAGFDASTRGVFFCNQPGLALCLPFESETVDRSSNNVALNVSNVSYVAGHDGKAVLLDQSSFIRAGANSVFDSTEATVEAWVNRVTGAGVVFDADGRYSMTILSNGNVQCATSKGSVSAGTAAAGSFVHVACVWGSGKVMVYIDGVLKDQDNAQIKSAPNATEAVGGNAPSGEPFVGAIDSLRIFNVARSADQIAAAAAP